MATEQKMLNLAQPIIVYYVNLGTISAAKSNEKIKELKDKFKYDNATIWIVPVKDQETKIELLYNPIGIANNVYNGKLNS